jgi:hypothetical protein
MSNWKYTLDIEDLWKQRDEGRITIQELGKGIANRLRILSRKLPTKYQDFVENLALDFESVDEDVEDFDQVMNDLYNLADLELPKPTGQWMDNKLMWVKTNF